MSFSFDTEQFIFLAPHHGYEAFLKWQLDKTWDQEICFAGISPPLAGVSSTLSGLLYHSTLHDTVILKHILISMW